MKLKPVRVRAWKTHSDECYSRFFEIQSFILTLNTTDDFSQVNSLPFLNLLFWLGGLSLRLSPLLPPRGLFLSGLRYHKSLPSRNGTRK